MDHMEFREIRFGDYSALINLSRGANLISLRHKAYRAKLLREPRTLREEPDHPFLYGMPILFPVNRVSGGEFTFEGREYRFGINEPSTGCHLHGHLHGAAFRAQEHTEHRIVCVRRVEENELYPAFPHAFEVRIEYELSENGLNHRTEIINRSDTNMPCLLGFHTTFNLGFTEQTSGGDVRALVELSEEYERNMETYLPTGNKPQRDAVTEGLAQGSFCPAGEPISRHYRSGGGGRMELLDRVHGLRLTYENDEKFGFRLIYNGQGDEFICMEPQTCPVDALHPPLNREAGAVDWIEPHQRKIYQSRIYITEENV